jgi:predicted nucleic acid-binding protein
LIAVTEIYVDPSVLVGCLIRDANTDQGIRLLGSASAPFFLTELTSLEILNALELAEFRQPSQSAAVARAKARFGDLLANGSWISIETDLARTFQRAQGLSRGHSRLIGCRSLNVAHVASAMEIGAREFWTFDGRQKELARQVGLKVND